MLVLEPSQVGSLVSAFHGLVSGSYIWTLGKDGRDQGYKSLLSVKVNDLSFNRLLNDLIHGVKYH